MIAFWSLRRRDVIYKMLRQKSRETEDLRKQGNVAVPLLQENVGCRGNERERVVFFSECSLMYRQVTGRATSQISKHFLHFPAMKFTPQASRLLHGALWRAMSVAFEFSVTQNPFVACGHMFFDDLYSGRVCQCTNLHSVATRVGLWLCRRLCLVHEQGRRIFRGGRRGWNSELGVRR